MVAGTDRRINPTGSGAALGSDEANGSSADEALHLAEVVTLRGDDAIGGVDDRCHGRDIEHPACT